MPGLEAGTYGDDLPARLLRLIRKTADVALPDSEITLDTGLLGRGIGFDSIEVLALVSAIEDEFGLTLDDADLRPKHFVSIGALVEFVRARLPR
jgi:acyl carrier protein